MHCQGMGFMGACPWYVQKVRMVRTKGTHGTYEGHAWYVQRARMVRTKGTHGTYKGYAWYAQRVRMVRTKGTRGTFGWYVGMTGMYTTATWLRVFMYLAHVT